MGNIGQKIDTGYSLMASTADSNLNLIHKVLPLKFDYLYTTQLLECIKAKLVIPRIQQHIDLGRKVILFHSYNHSKPSHPFDIPYSLYEKLPDSQRIRSQISLFNQLYPEYEQLDLHDLDNPIKTIKKNFTQAFEYNGNVTKMERDFRIKKFNEEGGYRKILIIQEDAGGEGISLHDRFGDQPRVIMYLNLPTKPNKIPQTEGRTYREGLNSNCVYEYIILGTNFEKLVFADKISKRVRTAENLAVGSSARNFEYAIKNGYLNPNSNPPSLNQGTGGKIADMEVNTDTLYKLSLKSYKKSRERGGNGLPEPIGYNMVRWLDAKTNDMLLEPFAGNGEIGRYFPTHTKNDYLEADIEKRANLSINVEKFNRIEPYHFDSHSIRNKYYGISFSEPKKGYVAKAFDYLKDTGRIVAVTKGVDNFLSSRTECVLRMTIYLPAILGFRKIMVIDKVVNPTVRYALSQQHPEPLSFNLIGIGDMEELFRELNKIECPIRLKPDKTI